MPNPIERGKTAMLLEEVHTLLQRIEYPTTKEDILTQLRIMDAPDDVINRVMLIPEYRYGSVNTVMDAVQNLE